MMQSQSKQMRVRHAMLAMAAGGAMLAPCMASAAVHTWIGGTDDNWNTKANWSDSSVPLDLSQIAKFDSDPTYQPGVNTSVTVIGAVWMAGTTVGDIAITSHGTITFQTNGSTITSNGVDYSGVGVLVDNTSSGTLTINTTSFKAGGTQSWINNSDNLFTISAPVNLNASTVTVAGSGSTLISGAISQSTGTGSLTKAGAGTLTLSNASIAPNGATTLTEGTLLVNGTMSSSSAVVTANGGTLGGTGTINRNTTINAGATLDPGASADTTGVLSIGRSLTLGGGAHFDLASTANHDAVSVNSSNSTGWTLTFGGSLDVDALPGLTFAAGQTYDLFDWGSKTTVSGTFSSIHLPTLSNGLSWEMYGAQPFDYTTGQISVVPEPFGLGALGLAGVGLVMSRRRQRR